MSSATSGPTRGEYLNSTSATSITFLGNFMKLDGDIIILQSEQHPLKSSWGVSKVLQVQAFMVSLNGECMIKDIRVKLFSSKETS